MQFDGHTDEEGYGRVSIPRAQTKAFKEIWSLIRKIKRVEAKLPLRIERDEIGDLVLEGIGAIEGDNKVVMRGGEKVDGAPAIVQLKLDPDGTHATVRYMPIASA
jgi:hypothetical protein